MYSVGQVVYVLLAKNNNVYPMQVIEVITKKTLRGEEIRYLLQGGTDKSSTLMLDQIKGEVFDTAEVARKTLIDRSARHIDKLIRTAVLKSKEWYGDQHVSSRETESIDNLPPLAPRSSPTAVHQDVQDEQEDEDDAMSSSQVDQDDVTYVTLPDGTVAKIKMPSIT